jgi:hypothetical protein
MLVRILWRMLISVTVVLLIAITGAISHYFLIHLDISLDSRSVFSIVWHAALTIGVWTLLIHCFIVLLRLFMFRTRVLGELIH